MWSLQPQLMLTDSMASLAACSMPLSSGVPHCRAHHQQLVALLLLCC